MAPCCYLNQGWLIIKGVLCHSPQCNFHGSAHGQWVKTLYPDLTLACDISITYNYDRRFSTQCCQSISHMSCWYKDIISFQDFDFIITGLPFNNTLHQWHWGKQNPSIKLHCFIHENTCRLQNLLICSHWMMNDQIADLMVNYGISNIIVLEIPQFITKTSQCLWWVNPLASWHVSLLSQHCRSWQYHALS